MEDAKGRAGDTEDEAGAAPLVPVAAAVVALLLLVAVPVLMLPVVAVAAAAVAAALLPLPRKQAMACCRPGMSFHLKRMTQRAPCATCACR